MVKVHHEGSSLKSFFKIFLIIFVLLFVLNFIFTSLVSDNILEPEIIIIPITGEISLYGNSGLFGGGGLSADNIIRQIEDADGDKNVAAIILEINTPGGTVVASEDIARAVQKSKKPTVAWMREVAASGGYWIAASADEIIADPATLTGSIGVTGSYLNFAGLFDEYGIRYERVVSGPYKDTGTPFRNLTNMEKIILQNKVDGVNEMFIDHIVKNRNMSKWEARQVATGEVFLGSEALSLGLVDYLGSKEEAIDLAEELAGITTSRIIEYEESPGFFERLSELKLNIEIKNSKDILALQS